MKRQDIKTWNKLAERLAAAERKGDIEARRRVLNDMALFLRRVTVPASAIPSELKK